MQIRGLLFLRKALSLFLAYFGALRIHLSLTYRRRRLSRVKISTAAHFIFTDYLRMIQTCLEHRFRRHSVLIFRRRLLKVFPGVCRDIESWIHLLDQRLMGTHLRLILPMVSRLWEQTMENLRMRDPGHGQVHFSLSDWPYGETQRNVSQG